MTAREHICGIDPFARGRRVLHVAQPVDGGVARYVDGIAGFQARRGWQVAVATGFAPAEDTVAWHEWHSVRSPVGGLVAESRTLRRIIEEHRPEVVVLHSAKAGLVGRTVLRGRLPTVYVPHAWSFLALPSGPAHAAAAWERLAGRWTNACLLVSPGEAATGTARHMRAPQFIVENPVPAGWLERESVAQSAARAALGLAEAPTAICVARMSRQKGIDVLLDSWQQVLRRFAPDGPGTPRLLIVGVREEEVPLDWVRTGVTFVGQVDDPRAYVDAADVFVLPSRWEGLSLAMLEAMAAGRSVVATQVAGSEVVARAACGTVVPVSDPDALADALAKRLADPELAAEEGRAARAYAAAHHALEPALEAFSAVVARAHAFGSSRAG